MRMRIPHVDQYERKVLDPVTVHQRHWHADARGKLLEALREDDPLFKADFGQAYITTIRPGVVKAWHYHKRQTDRMLLLCGEVRFGCVRMPDNDLQRSSVLLDLIVTDIDPMLIVIPPNIYHGFMNIGQEEAYVLNIPTEMYDHKDPDEARLRYDHFGDSDTSNPYQYFNWEGINIHG